MKISTPLLAAALVTAVTQFAPQAASATSLQCQTLPPLFNAFIYNHYSHKSLNDEIKKRVVTRFIENLDPSKTLLLKNDVEALKKSLAPVFTTMRSGNCQAIYSAHQLLLKRVQETEAFVKGFLNKKYKLDESTELVLNADKRDYPETEKEREDILKKMIHFQISNYLLADTALDEAKKNLVHRYELITKRTRERKHEDVLDLYMEAFAQGLDPHSSFLSRDDMEDFQIQMQLSLEGIGASLSSRDGYTVIEELIPGGGASKSGSLKAKDKIIAVAQDGKTPVSVIDMDLRDVVRLIRGKKGTKVSLTILRQAEGLERFEVTIVRDKIDLKDQAAKITYQEKNVNGRNVKLGVIDFPSFYGGEKDGRSSYEDIKKLLLEAKAKKADGILLDLSRNGGGLLEDAVKIAGLFIRKGEVVSTKTTRGNVEPLADEDESVAWTGPLVILTSRLSASASEILAGALQDYGRAVVVGNDHTFGKGTVQVLAGLPGGLGAMKVTTGMYFLPKGHSTQHKGVSADIVLPFGFDATEVGEKHLDHSLPPQKIPSFASKEVNSSKAEDRWDPVDAELLKILAGKSEARVKEDPEFAEIREKVAKSASSDIVKLAEIRAEALKEKTAKKKKEDRGTAQSDKDEKLEDQAFLKEGVNILVDLISLKTKAISKI